MTAPTPRSRSKKFWSSIRITDGEPDYPDDSPESNLRAYLWGMRIKATNARIDILQHLAGESEPMTVKKIVEKLGKNVSTMTTYRNLEILADAGLINRIDLGHGHAHYEIAMGRKHHHHAVCTSCGEIEDVTACAKEALEDMSAGLKKFRDIKSHSLEFFGLCRRCESANK